MDVLALLRRSLESRYDVERQTGAGGMALVFRAKDLKHDRWVAIKLLQPELAASIGTQRFLREIAFAASLQHPNLLPVYDSGEAEGQLYYVMPFVEGESLAVRLAQYGPQPLADVVSIVRDVASALTFAHGRGVIHRDIKPDNILLLGTRAMVADLGIARALNQAREGALTGSGMAIGTAHYMSPEQALGDETAAEASDQYSLGCVTYEMLTGEQPFRAPSLPAVLAKVISAPRPRPSATRPELPVALDAVVTRALDADPAARFVSCDAFATALDAAARTAETRAETAAVQPRSASAVRRRSVAWIVGGSIAAAATVLGLRAARTTPATRTGAATAMSDASTTRIVIHPFEANGAANAILGTGMIDLVAANLSNLEGVEVVASADSTAARRSEPVDAIVTGSLIALGSQARIVARVVRADGTEISRMQFGGSQSSLLILIDSMSVAVLRAVWGKARSAPTGRTGALTTSSIPAVQEFLAGQQSARSGEWRQAADHFSTAIGRDSTFALAYAALANAYAWTDAHGTPAALRMFALGARHIAQLPAREQRLFRTAHALSRGDIASSDSALAYVRAYPHDLDGWLVLGEARFHGRTVVAAAAPDIFAPFDTIIARDPNYVPAYVHPIELAAELGDGVRLARYVQAYALRAPRPRAERAQRVLRGLSAPPDTFATIVQQLAEDSEAQTLLVALLSAPARRSLGHELAATEGLRRSVASARTAPATVPNRSYVLARYFAGTGQADSATRVVEALLRMPRAENAAFAAALAISMSAPAAARCGAIADSMLAEIKDRSPLLQLLRAERAMTRRDTALARRLAAPLIDDTTNSRDVAGQAQGVIAALAILAGDTVSGVRDLDAGLATSGLRAYALTSAPLRFVRAAALASSTRAGDDTRAALLLRTGFTDDLEYILPVRALLNDRADAVWLRVHLTATPSR
jgi:TolB-like protein